MPRTFLVKTCRKRSVPSVASISDPFDTEGASKSVDFKATGCGSQDPRTEDIQDNDAENKDKNAKAQQLRTSIFIPKKIKRPSSIPHPLLQNGRDRAGERNNPVERQPKCDGSRMKDDLRYGSRDACEAREKGRHGLERNFVFMGKQERPVRKEMFLDKLRKYMTLDDSNGGVERFQKGNRTGKRPFKQGDGACAVRRPVALIPEHCSCPECLEGPKMRISNDSPYESRNERKNGHCFSVHPKRFRMYERVAKPDYFYTPQVDRHVGSHGHRYSDNEDTFLSERVSQERAARYLIERKIRSNWANDVSKEEQREEREERSWVERTHSVDQDFPKIKYRIKKEEFWRESRSEETEPGFDREHEARFRQRLGDKKKGITLIENDHDEQREHGRGPEMSSNVTSSRCQCPDCIEEEPRRSNHDELVDEETESRVRDGRLVCKREYDEAPESRTCDSSGRSVYCPGTDECGSPSSNVDAKDDCFSNEEELDRKVQMRTFNKMQWGSGNGAADKDDENVKHVVVCTNGNEALLNKKMHYKEERLDESLPSPPVFDKEAKFGMAGDQDEEEQCDASDFLACSPPLRKGEYQSGTSKEKRLLMRQAKEKTIGKKSRALANWLERKRVAELNDAFERLRKMVPAYGNEDRSLSKIKTLRYASTYINHLAVIHEKQCRFGIEDLKDGLVKFVDMDPMLQRCQEHLESQCII